MKTRCNNKNFHQYADYGGRGIGYCKEWEHFENFYNDMGDKPEFADCLDRKDNNKSYSKENCHWTTNKVNNNNKRSNKSIKYKGKRWTLAELCDEFNLDYHLVKRRLHYGWEVHRAVEDPVRKMNRKIQYKNECLTVKQWSKKTGIPAETIRHRLEKWPTKKALTEPINTTMRDNRFGRKKAS